MEIRKEILEYAEQMELKMRKHDERRGDSWKTCHIGYLLKRIQDEWIELQMKIDINKNNPSFPLVGYNISEGADIELIDVSNFSMMLWYRLQPMEKK